MTPMIPTLVAEEKLWRLGLSRVAGVDEVGRGALAGPVVAAAVIFPHTLTPIGALQEVNDSKQLTATKREALEEPIKTSSLDWAYGHASAAEIDRLGIVMATHVAMRRAIRTLTLVEFVLVDAFFIPHLSGLRRDRQRAMKDGDARCFSIAAASILAKVHRDRLMKKLGVLHPQYKLEQHKGYGTSAHRRAITRFGPKHFHRKTFMRKLSLDQ